jgi:hypothetical protein
MTKGEMFEMRKVMSEQDQREFDRWLRVNLIVGSFFAAGIMAMAFASSGALEPKQALAMPTASAQTTVLTPPAPEPFSSYPLTVRIAPDALPVQYFDAF